MSVKMKDVLFDDASLENLKLNPIFRVNAGQFEMDFNDVYYEVQQQEFELNEDQVQQIKTDLFIAYCNGGLRAFDTNSFIRKNFVMPNELKAQKDKIITGAENANTSKGGIILP